MKHYVASNAATGCWWNGTAFSDEGTLAVITAPELAVLRATYENVIAAEVVSLPTITEEEFEEQEKERERLNLKACRAILGEPYDGLLGPL